jgi:hypothetical protein
VHQSEICWLSNVKVLDRIDEHAHEIKVFIIECNSSFP